MRKLAHKHNGSGARVDSSGLVRRSSNDDEFSDENAGQENQQAVVKPEPGTSPARPRNGPHGDVDMQAAPVLGERQNVQAADSTSAPPAAQAALIKKEGMPAQAPGMAAAAEAEADADMEADSDWEDDDDENMYPDAVDDEEEEADGGTNGARHGPEPDILAFEDEEQAQAAAAAQAGAAPGDAAGADAQAEEPDLEFLKQPIAPMEAVVLPEAEEAQARYVDRTLAWLCCVLGDSWALMRHVFEKLQPCGEGNVKCAYRAELVHATGLLCIVAQ